MTDNSPKVNRTKAASEAKQRLASGGDAGANRQVSDIKQFPSLKPYHNSIYINNVSTIIPEIFFDFFSKELLAKTRQLSMLHLRQGI